MAQRLAIRLILLLLCSRSFKLAIDIIYFRLVTLSKNLSLLGKALLPGSASKVIRSPAFLLLPPLHCSIHLISEVFLFPFEPTDLTIKLPGFYKPISRFSLH